MAATCTRSNYAIEGLRTHGNGMAAEAASRAGNCAGLGKHKTLSRMTPESLGTWYLVEKLGLEYYS